ncbi:MAG TPA: hypothetical protein VLG10_07680 [Methylomirabilota bacterium]|nr:hypothetical protein [Methylomirabilota bacterium]
MYATYLQSAGFRVVEATDGTSAIGKARNMNGWQACRWLKTNVVFRVEVVAQNYNGALEAILKQIDSRQGRECTVATTGGWSHFHRMTVGGRRVVGDVLRVQTDQLPAAADRDGEIEDPALEKDQGIAAYFYYRRGGGA